MTEIGDKKAALFKELSATPGNLVTARNTTVNKANLAEEMKDILATALLQGKQTSAFNLGEQKVVLKGTTAVNIINFKFNTPANYLANLGFTFPTDRTFGYLFLDDNGNELTLTDSSDGDPNDISNFYLTKRISTNELVSVDDDPAAFITPTIAKDIFEIITEVQTQGSLITSTLTQDPVLKISPIATIKILSDGTLIGEIDEKGNITNVTNTKGATLDISSSSFDFTSRKIELFFEDIPSASNATITVTYDTAQSAVSKTENHVSFDSNTFAFSRILSSVPVIKTIEISLNGIKKALVNKEAKPYGIDIDTGNSFYNSVTREISIIFRGITTASANTANFAYTIEDNIAVNDTVGGFQQTSLTLPQHTTKNTPIIVAQTRIFFNNDLVATVNSAGVVSGTYPAVNSSTGIITGTVTSAGVINLTLTAESADFVYPISTINVRVEYDFVSGLAAWQNTYAFVNPISLSTKSYTGGVLNQINLDSSEINSAPGLLRTYPMKSFADHQPFGNIIVVTEGLEINLDWVPIFIRNDGVIDISTDNNELTSVELTSSTIKSGTLANKTLILYNYNGQDSVSFTISTNDLSTGSITITTTFPVSATNIKYEISDLPENSTKLTNASFKLLLSWMNPDNESVDDIIKSSNPNNLSNGGNSPTYPDIRKNPFFPETDGNHETLNQAFGLALNDIFVGYHLHTEDSTDKWQVVNSERWQWDATPPLGSQTFTAILDTDMATFRDLVFATNAIPADGNPDSGDTYTLVGIELQKNGSRFACKYNDIQDMLDAATGLSISRLETLRIVSGNFEFIDPFGDSVEDILWWQAVEDVNISLTALTTAHNTWRSNYVNGVADNYTDDDGSGNPSALADTFQNDIKTGIGTVDFYDVCFDSGTGRLPIVETRIGAATTTGYSNEIFKIANKMADKNIGYVRDVLLEYFGLQSFYTQITNARIKYRAFEEAEPN